MTSRKDGNAQARHGSPVPDPAKPLQTKGEAAPADTVAVSGPHGDHSEIVQAAAKAMQPGMPDWRPKGVTTLDDRLARDDDRLADLKDLARVLDDDDPTFAALAAWAALDCIERGADIPTVPRVAAGLVELIRRGLASIEAEQMHAARAGESMTGHAEESMRRLAAVNRLHRRQGLSWSRACDTLDDAEGRPRDSTRKALQRFSKKI